MKRRWFCITSSDLKIATLIVSLFINSLIKVVDSHQLNGFHISHKIIHNQPQLPTSGAAAAETISYSHFDGDQQDLAPLAMVKSSRQTAAAADVDNQASSSQNEDGSLDSDREEAADNSQDLPDRSVFSMDQHNSQLQAMHDLFERRQLNNHQLQSSQELSPISIGLDPVPGAGSPFNMPPFSVPNHDHAVPHNKPPMSNADNLDQGMGPSLPFGLNPLPHLLGFQSPPFDGPQRGDQSAHANHHTAMSSTESEVGQKVWPKIFRFTDGRINLSEFEKQKKIRLSSKNQHNGENHIESAPIMFDGRQLKRKSFLILHGGIFSR